MINYVYENKTTVHSQHPIYTHYCYLYIIYHTQPENLLLSSKSKDAVTKLADFGLAVELNDPNQVEWFGK